MELAEFLDVHLNKLGFRDFISGRSDEIDVKNYDDYDLLIRYRHDLVHFISSRCLGSEFGERRVDEIIRENYSDKYDLVVSTPSAKFILRQTPDIYRILGSHLTFYDVAVSSTPKIRSQSKRNNYSELIRTLRSCCIDCSFVPLVFSLDGTNISDHLSHLKASTLELIATYLSRINLFLTQFHATDLGFELLKLYREFGGSSLLPECPSSDRLIRPRELYHEDYWSDKHLSTEDNDFIDGVVDTILDGDINLPPKLTYNDAWLPILTAWQSKYLSCLEMIGGKPIDPPKELLFDHGGMRLDDSDKLQSFGEIRLLDTNDEVLYLELCRALQASITRVSDSEWKDPRAAGVGHNDHFNVFSRSVELKTFVRRNLFKIALKGPFRKKVFKKDAAKLSREDRELRDLAIIESGKRKNYVMSPIDSESHKEITKLLDIMSCTNDVLRWRPKYMSSRMFNMWRSTIAGSTSIQVLDSIMERNWGQHMLFLQLIMREIARSINRLQKIRRDRFIFTKVPEITVYIIVYPGGVLRSEANPAYYQLIYPKSSIVGLTSFAPDEFPIAEGWVISDVRSVDCYRLESYCVGFDKIAMATIAHFESTGLDYDNFNNYLDSSDFPAFESLMLIEGKLTTATSLSAGRYILMNCLAVNRDPSKCLEKLEAPIRSRLHLYGIRRMMLFTKAMDKLPPENFSRLRRMAKDDNDDELYNIGVDIDITLPPIFSRFKYGQIPLRMAICEIYLHMTYHKDRANPTHDERRILEKILKCQYEYDDSDLGVEMYGLRPGMSDLDYAREILCGSTKPFTYSARAVNIASKLQRMSLKNRSNEIDPFYPLHNHERLNFNFTDIAQFKASVPMSAQNVTDRSKPPQLTRGLGVGMSRLATK